MATHPLPQIRSAEHDAREAAGATIPLEPQDPEPNWGTPGVQDATGGKVNVPIRGMRFTPAVMHVKVGQIVVFTDEDRVGHTVRNIAGGLPHSGLIPPGGRFEFTPLKPGVIRYHDIVYPRMRGVLIVGRQPRGPTGAAPRKPSCRKLLSSARHELGDPTGEVYTHCRQ